MLDQLKEFIRPTQTPEKIKAENAEERKGAKQVVKFITSDAIRVALLRSLSTEWSLNQIITSLGAIDTYVDFLRLDPVLPDWFNTKMALREFLRPASPFFWTYLFESVQLTKDGAKAVQALQQSYNSQGLGALGYNFGGTAHGLSESVILNGLGVTMGSNIRLALTERGGGLAQGKSAIEVGERFKTTVSKPREIYDRLIELYKPTSGVLGAFDALHRSGAFRDKNVGDCAGKGVAAVLFDNYGDILATNVEYRRYFEAAVSTNPLTS